MIIPNKIRIGNFDYDVELTEQPILLDYQLCSGLCDVHNQLIQIDAGLTDQNKERVLWHETVHGLFEYLGLDFGEKNENIVDSVARGVMQLVRDNPLMFITEDVVEEYLYLMEEELEEKYYVKEGAKEKVVEEHKCTCSCKKEEGQKE